MFIEDVGAGPAVLLMHGSPTDPAYFRPLVEALRPDCRVLVPHFPGYGKSPPIPGSNEPSKVLAALEGALLGLGVMQTAAVGHSLGAYRAMALALSGRVRVSRLVLLGGFAGLPAAHADALRGLAGTVRGMSDFSDPAFRLQIALMCLAPAKATPAALAAVGAWLDSTTPESLADELEGTSRCEDLLPRLAGLRIPLLALVGELDAAAPVSYSQGIVAAVPGAVLQRVAGCGHALLVEDEGATVETIRAAVCAAREDQHSSRKLHVGLG